jgi:site-specific DNA-methyltransferase (adenine-specific)
MEALRKMDDNQFDLAIVDPPYGINYGLSEGFESVKRANGTTGHTTRKKHAQKEWDSEPPSDRYFEELRRVSENQIIWGGNYFDLPPTRGIICWDKNQSFSNFSAWEMAWTSTTKPASIFRYDNKGFMCKDGAKIHPTQKPVALYKWLLSKYAKEGDTILDTHLGSGSIAIACHDMKFDLTGYELDSDYYQAACERLEAHRSQSQFSFD